MDNVDEEFSLGGIEEHDFSLGEIAAPSAENPAKISKESTSGGDDLEKVYSLLKIAEKPDRIDYKEYFKSNPEVFLFVGLDYVRPPNQEQFQKFEERCLALSAEANRKWRATENLHKIHELDKAFGTLKAIFGNKNATANFINETNRILNRQLESVLLGKVKKDKILDVSEILEIMELSFSIHRIPNNPSGKKALIDWIKLCQKNFDFEIEPFSRTFIRIVREKPEIERLDTEPCKKKLFSEYKKLYEINEQVSGEPKNLSDESIYGEMCEIIQRENLFVENVFFYDKNFFQKVKESSKYNFALPLNDEFYYYLKGTAIHTYHFSDEQWSEFTRTQNPPLRKEDDASVAFIMGTLKASTLSEISELLAENPNMALSRIRSGDVETYLYHIGQRDMAKKLSSIKEQLKADTDILVESTAKLLKEADSSESDEDEAKSTDSLIPLIERNASPKEIVSYLLRRKQYESLNKRILSKTSEEHIRLEDYLLENNFSFTKMCLNYLAQFPDESNAAAYKNMFETYADYVLEKLTSQGDSLTLDTVLKPVIECGKNIISPDFYERAKWR